MPEQSEYDFEAERQRFAELRRRQEDKLGLGSLVGRGLNEAQHQVQAAGGRVEIYDADADNPYSMDIDTGCVRLWVRGSLVVKATLG